MAEGSEYCICEADPNVRDEATVKKRNNVEQVALVACPDDADASVKMEGAERKRPRIAGAFVARCCRANQRRPIDAG